MVHFPIDRVERLLVPLIMCLESLEHGRVGGCLLKMSSIMASNGNGID